MRKAFSLIELIVVLAMIIIVGASMILGASMIGKPVAVHDDVVIKVQEKFPNPLGDGSGEVEYRIVAADGRIVITYDAALYAGLVKDKTYKVRCEEYSDGPFVVVAVIEENPTQF